MLIKNDHENKNHDQKSSWFAVGFFMQKIKRNLTIEMASTIIRSPRRIEGTRMDSKWHNHSGRLPKEYKAVTGTWVNTKKSILYQISLETSWFINVLWWWFSSYRMSVTNIGKTKVVNTIEAVKRQVFKMLKSKIPGGIGLRFARISIKFLVWIKALIQSLSYLSSIFSKWPASDFQQNLESFSNFKEQCIFLKVYHQSDKLVLREV